MKFFSKLSILTVLAAFVLLGFGCKSVSKQYSQPKTAKVDRTEYKNYHNFYVLSYPSNWRIAEYSDAPEIVGFIAPDNPAAPGYAPIAEVSVIVRDNPTSVDIKKFYIDHKENIFTEASSVLEIAIGDAKGYFLKEIPGEITVDLTILVFDDKIVEFELTEDKYKEDYDALIRSFLFSKPMIYENEEYGINLILPSGWDYYERNIDESYPDSKLWVDFDSKSIIFRPNTDIVYPISLTIYHGELEKKLAQIKNEFSLSNVALGENVFAKFSYYNELVDRNFDVYFTQKGDYIYEFTGDSLIEGLEDIVASLRLREEKQYINSKMRYSVQMPPDWNARDIHGDGTVVGFNLGPVPVRAVIDSIRINVNSNPNNLSVEDFYRQPLEVQLFEDAKGGVESAKVNGRDVLRFKDVIGLVNYEIVVIPIGTRIVEIQLSEPLDNKEIFERMLRTFNATPLNWREYKNIDWGLRFIYPNTWEIREQDKSSSEFSVYVDNSFPLNTVGTDFIPDINISVVQKPLAEFLKGYTKNEQLQNFKIGKINWLRYRYYSDLLSENVMLCVYGFGNKTIVIEAPESIVNKSEFYNIVNSLEVSYQK